MKKIVKTFLIITFLPNIIHAEERVAGCLKSVSTLSGPIEVLNKELTSCGFNKGLAELEKVKKDQEEYVLDKLSSKLALQINQNLEETALLTNFFNSNGDDLLMKDSDPDGKIKNACSLSQLKKIETCGSSKRNNQYNAKLNLLMNKLNPSGKKSKYGDGLFGVLAEKYTKSLGISGLGGGSSLQCPLDGGVSDFILASQLDEISANDILKGVGATDDVFKTRFDSFAQLKIIKDAGKTDEFKKYLSLFNPKKDLSAKKYITQFFTNKKNQKDFIVPAMAESCARVTKNLNRFLCSELEELGSTDSKVSSDLFNKLDVAPMDDQYEIDFKNDPVALRAYGFQCLALVKNKNSHFQNEEKLDDWYKDFTSNTRPEVSSDKANDKNNAFCANYSCSTAEAKNMISCKAGGPLTSADFSKMKGCDLVPLGENCQSDALKAIAYLEGNEKLRTSAGMIFGSSESSAPSQNDAKKSKSTLPDFAENFLGVEGSLIALGKPVTPITVAEKTQDFKDRQLATANPPYEPPTRKTEVASNETNNAGNSLNGASYVENNNMPPIGNSNLAINNSFMPTSNSKTSGPITGVRNKSKAKDSSYWTDDNDETAPAKTKHESAKNNEVVNHDAAIANKSGNSEFNKEQFENYKNQVARELSANRDRINSVNGELSRTQRELVDTRAEMERRLSSLERKYTDAKNSNDPKEVAEAKNFKKEADTVRADIAKLSREPAAVSSGGGVIITTEKLKSLKEDELQKMGIDIDESFVIAVKVKDEKDNTERLVNIPVIRHSSNGKSYLIPRYDGKNSEIMKAIEKSPLFKDFIREVKSKMKTFTNLRDFIKA